MEPQEEVKPVFEVGNRIPLKRYSPYRSLYPVFRRTPGTEPSDSDLWGFLVCEQGWGKRFRILGLREADEGSSASYAGFAPSPSRFGESIFVYKRETVLQDIAHTQHNTPSLFAKFKTVAEIRAELSELNARIRQGQLKLLESMRQRVAQLRAQIAMLFTYCNDPGMPSDHTEASKQLVDRLASELGEMEESIRKQERMLFPSKS